MAPGLTMALFVHMMINTILTPALTVALSESRSQGSGRCFLVKSTRYCFLVKFTLKKVVSDNIRAGVPAFLCSLYNSVLVIRIFQHIPPHNGTCHNNISLTSGPSALNGQEVFFHLQHLLNFSQSFSHVIFGISVPRSCTSLSQRFILCR
ncbi:Uncharacterised protein [Escherichia coli]|nr:Uncharacterised protein [Escherichia coli]